MSTYDYNEDEPSFLQKYRFVIVALVVLLIVGSVALSFYFFAGKIPPPRKPQEITISLPPPPPPPPPPPTPPPPKPPPEPKMVMITPVKPMDKPKDVKAPDKAPGPPGPKATGPASDDGLAGAGGGGGLGGGGGQDPLAVYAGEVQDAVRQALSRNSATNHASIHKLKVKIWISSTGRVTRAAPSGSSGDSTVDDALKNQALVGLQIPDPPPSGKGISIYMFIDATRPQ